MSKPFACLKSGQHLFMYKSNKGTVCRNCGVVSTANSPIAYKSSRYAGKIHFNMSDYENILEVQREGYEITSLDYLKSRPKLIRFVLEKGKQLKMSQKTLHIAIQVMDIYFEMNHKTIKSSENFLVAACSMLLGAKSGELDERIPFIGKLKKYTNLYNSRNEFKETEVAIARALKWDLQKITFFSFIEMFLTSGVVVPDDRASKTFVNSLSVNGIDDTVRMLVKEESSSQRNQNIERTANMDKIDEKAYESYKNNKQNYTEVGTLTYSLRNALVKTFEFYVKDLCNLIVEEFKFWEFDKKILATSIILYARSAVFDPSCTWNLRLKDLTDLELRDIRKTYGKICKFVTGSKLTVASPKNPLKQLNFNSNSKPKLQKKSSISSNYTSLKNFKTEASIKIIGEKKYTGNELKTNNHIVNGSSQVASQLPGNHARKPSSSNITSMKRFDIENNPM